jgi:hypothetical protein
MSRNALLVPPNRSERSDRCVLRKTIDPVPLEGAPNPSGRDSNRVVTLEIPTDPLWPEVEVTTKLEDAFLELRGERARMAPRTRPRPPLGECFAALGTPLPPLAVTDLAFGFGHGLYLLTGFGNAIPVRRDREFQSRSVLRADLGSPVGRGCYQCRIVDARIRVAAPVDSSLRALARSPAPDRPPRRAEV